MSMAKKTAKKKAMSDDHKAALAEGRRQGAAVSAYLDALESHKPKRGRKRTPESIQRQLTEIEQALDNTGPAAKLDMLQRRRDLERDLENLSEDNDITHLETAFVEVAADYSSRRGIEYATWREAGVSAATLRAAGISRGRN